MPGAGKSDVSEGNTGAKTLPVYVDVTGLDECTGSLFDIVFQFGIKRFDIGNDPKSQCQ